MGSTPPPSVNPSPWLSSDIVGRRKRERTLQTFQRPSRVTAHAGRLPAPTVGKVAQSLGDLSILREIIGRWRGRLFACDEYFTILETVPRNPKPGTRSHSFSSNLPVCNL